MQRENCETTQAPEQNRDTRASAVSTVSKSKKRKKKNHTGEATWFNLLQMFVGGVRRQLSKTIFKEGSDGESESRKLLITNKLFYAAGWMRTNASL